MIDAPDLLNYLQREEARATDTTLNEERKTALEFYRGDLFGDEVDGRSKLRTRDVAEVVDYMLASILRTLVSSDKVVEFEPSTPGQDDLAQQITDRVHWNFLREQDGFSILRDGIKAGLLEKSGVWKSWVEPSRKTQPAQLNASQMEQMEAAYQQDKTQPRVVRWEPIDDQYDVEPTMDETGSPVLDEYGQHVTEAVQVYDCVVSVPGKKLFRDAALPNEQFFYSPDTRTLAKTAYCGDWCYKSLNDLMEMGYTEDEVRDLWGDTGTGQQLADARDEGRSNKDSDNARPDYGRVVVFREEYVCWDWQGYYQEVRVHRVHTAILSVEPTSGNPYTLWCPFPMQHRLIGQSLADKTMDIQVVRSHMLRQAMDNLYLSNAPQKYVDMSMCDETTLDDVLDVGPGGIVRGRGANGVQNMVTPFVAGPAFEAMQIMAGEKESRTGITRLNQGIDADALNKTATGTALMQASGQQMEELVAREVANAVGEMFEKKLQLMIAQMEPHQFSTDGKVVDMDPSNWPQDLRLAVRVGLGSGNKDKKLQGIAILKQTQAEARAVDPRLVPADKAMETAKLVCSTLGLGPSTQYFAELPRDPQGNVIPAPPQPNPDIVKAQMSAQQSQMELQQKAQSDASDLQLRQQESAARIELDRQKAEAEMQLARERMAAEFQLKREQMLYQASANTNLPSDRPGGSLAS